MFPKLEIFTLGGIEVQSDGIAFTGFRSRKVLALLAYLAAQPQPQPREALAELLWEGRTQAQSLSNLRVAIADLRKYLGDVLDIRRDRVGLCRNEHVWIDLDSFDAYLDGQQLEAGISLYRGEFLEGFYAPDAEKFDNWLIIERERYHQKAIATLQRLVQTYRQRKDYNTATTFTQRLVQLDRLNEIGQMEMLRLLSISGQRSEALVQFERYRRLIQNELGIEPSLEMLDLVSRLQSNQPITIPAQDEKKQIVPKSSVGIHPTLQSNKQVFVGRQREISELEAYLHGAFDGRGSIAFISGEAGSGKTALMEAFVSRMQGSCPSLLSLTGNCTVFAGTGDPFLPFREILSLLIGSDQKGLVEIVLQAILQHGPDLVGSFLLPRQVISVVGTPETAWQKELVEDASRKATRADSRPLFDVGSILEQYTAVMVAVAQIYPLLIFIDDLQWADPSSVSLLCHLSRRIHTNRILIVGTYRPEETSDEQNPLGRTLAEFKRQFGDNRVDLNRRSETDARNFIDELIDSEPNRLEDEFRQRFTHHSGGHALFAVELLRDLKERGLLVKDQENQWIEKEKMNWAVLPAKIEAVIEMHAAKLDPKMVETLKVASILGVEFSAEIVARIFNMDPLELVHHLTAGSVKKSRFVQEMGFSLAGGRKISLFRFSHELFQHYFFDRISEAERAYLHERVALAVEDSCKDRPEEFSAASARLAWHFSEAGCIEKSIDYRLMAGNRAASLGASEDAAGHFQQGVDLLTQIDNFALRNSKELALRLASCAPLQALKGYTAPEVRSAYLRVKELSAHMGKKLDLLPALYLLRTYHHCTQDRIAAFEFAQEILEDNDRTCDSCLITVAHWTLGSELAYRGEFRQARLHLEQAVKTYDPINYGWLVNFYGNDPGLASRSRLSWVLWFLGYPDQARQYSQESLEMSDKFQNPLVRGFVIGRSGVMFHQIVGEVDEAQRWNTISREYSSKMRATLFAPPETISAGWIKTERGEVQEGIDWMRQGLDAWQTSGAVMHLPHYLAMYASGLLKARQVEAGLAAVAEGLEAAERNNESYYKAELYRIQGDLYCQKHAVKDAEIAFESAIQVAQIQEAKSLELRAMISLYRLWLKQGRVDQGRGRLCGLFRWFNEGDNNKDLSTARNLLRLEK